MPPTFDQAFRDARREAAATVGPDRLRDLHRRSGVRHALVALRQVALLAVAAWLIIEYPGRPWVWIPASVLVGFVVFSLTVLLHEVVHGLVFAGPRPWANRLLAFLYAVPSGLSPSQFRRWHLDHHKWLGTGGEDPKRRYLSPQRTRRWLKALYFTPALFPIYFRAARRAAERYPDALRRTIQRERRVAIGFHVAVPVVLGLTLGWPLALKLHLLPIFVVFPVAFSINRLGQHYDVVADDPARWGTLLRRSPLLWDVLFLWSNYHLEHHTFPGVPCYRLPALRRALDPYFAAHGAPSRTYLGLLRDWFLGNRVPHTDWSGPTQDPRGSEARSHA